MAIAQHTGFRLRLDFMGRIVKSPWTMRPLLDRLFGKSSLLRIHRSFLYTVKLPSEFIAVAVPLRAYLVDCRWNRVWVPRATDLFSR